MSSTTTANTISALIAIFAIEGYPKTNVSDNGPQLTAESFKEFSFNMELTTLLQLLFTQHQMDLLSASSKLLKLLSAKTLKVFSKNSRYEIPLFVSFHPELRRKKSCITSTWSPDLVDLKSTFWKTN